MNEKQLHALVLRETDVEGALHRLCDSVEMYETCLRVFLEDQTMNRLNECVKGQVWDDAFTMAHALKGMAGNMGFVPLMHAVSQLVVLIRGGRIKEIGEAMEQVNSCYRDIVDAIHQYFTFTNEGERDK